MVDFTLIGIAIGLLLIIIILFKFMHGIFKILAAVFSLFVLVGVILGGLVAYDVYKFQKAAQDQPMAYALMQDGKVLTGMSLQPGSEPKLLPPEDVSRLESSEYEGLLAKYYKVWIFSPAVVDGLSKTEFNLSGIKVTKEQIKSALLSDNPAQMFGVQVPFSSPEIKMMIFGSVVMQEVMKDPISIFREYKRGGVVVVKETALFKFMRYVPLSFIKSVLDKSVQKISEKVS